MLLGVLFRLAVVAFIGLLLDGCVNRDPCVRLPGGYAIMAISPGSPCGLTYEPNRDLREYSDWHSLRSTSQEPTGEQKQVFLLHNRKTGETVKFASEAAWRTATKQKKARPIRPDADVIDGIKAFGVRGSFVFGDCDKGYFLLDTANNEYVILAHEPWVQQVSAKTGSPPARMGSPRSPFVQSRDALGYALPGLFMLILLPWAFAPWWKAKDKSPELRGREATTGDLS